MASIYDSVKKNQQDDLAQKFNTFVNNFNNQFIGMRPEQIGPQLVTNGVIPQAQFEQFRQIANAVTGMNK